MTVDLDVLLAELAPVPPGADVDVSSIELDSRRVVPGALFCCIPGEHADGHDHAPDAVAAGAVALLAERPVAVDVPTSLVPSVRTVIGPVAARLSGSPSTRLDVVGITGTNGKTTTAELVRVILEHAARPTTVIGTLTGARTTPEAPELQRLLSGAVDAGQRAVAMEVSSHALAQHRVDGTRMAVAVFTNLSRDHLDYHPSMEAYFRAKARLFTPELAAAAVVNVDDPHGRLLLDAAVVPTVGFGLADADDLHVTAAGSDFTWRGHEVHLSMVGRFNVANAVAAATACSVLGVDDATIAAALSSPASVPGRFERIDAGQPFTVVVDFAHTPDGLEQALAAARELAGPHRVLVVFGCGGDRDATKRPEMGEVAARMADLVVVTADNSRHEQTGDIIDAIVGGIPAGSTSAAIVVEADRARAIGLALEAAHDGDVVVVAGKGHETTQTLGDVTSPFDDRVVVAAALADRRRHR